MHRFLMQEAKLIHPTLGARLYCRIRMSRRESGPNWQRSSKESSLVSSRIYEKTPVLQNQISGIEFLCDISRSGGLVCSDRSSVSAILPL